MKISLYESVGEWSKSCDVEYDANNSLDRLEAEEYFNKFFATPYAEDAERLANIPTETEGEDNV